MTEQEITEIGKISGQVRGAVFQTDAHYIITNHGKSGMTKIEEAMGKLGYPMVYKNIKALEWLPMRQRILAFLTMRDTFTWADEDFKKMGDSAPKHSFILRLLSKFMVSAQMTFNVSSEFWKKHHSAGNLVPVELNEKEKHAVIRIKDFLVHPLYCRYLDGYLCRFFQYMFPKARINSTESKCQHNGDDFHEFKFTW